MKRILEFFPPSVSQKQFCFLLQSAKLSPGFPRPDKGNNSSLWKQNEMKLSVVSVHFVLFDGKKEKFMLRARTNRCSLVRVSQIFLRLGLVSESGAGGREEVRGGVEG